jgi:ATP-binding cassette subfamily B protein
VSVATIRPADSPGARESLFEDEALGRAYDTRLMARLWRYVAPYRLQVATTLLFVLPLLLFDLAPAWIVKAGLDRVIVPAATGAPPLATPASDPGGAFFGPLVAAAARLLAAPEGVPPLVWLALLYIVVSAGGSLFMYLDQLIMARTGQAAMRDLRREVFGHIQALHLGFFDTMPVGRLVTRATNDVENVSEMFSAGIVALIRDVFKMLGIAVVLFSIDARLAFFTFLVVPVLAAAAFVFRFKARQAFRSVRVRIARINAYLQEHVTGMKIVQLFTREERCFRDFDEMNADHRDAWLQSIRYDSALFAVVEFASNLTIAIVIWQAVGLAEAGTIYVFIEYMRRFFMPLRDLSAKYSVMQSSMASCERIFHLLDTPPAVSDAPDAAPVAHAEGQLGAVEFQNVWFTYDERVERSPTASPEGAQRPGAPGAPGERSGMASPEGAQRPGAPGAPGKRSGAAGEGQAESVEPEWVLRDVSFRVAPGERVAFVGATGAGKTTLIKLLTRFYDVTRGRILIDGVELSRWPQADLRRRIAMVLQDVFLFSGSIADNLSLERPEVDRQHVEEVARAVQAHRFIDSLPQGYDTPVRERGSNFSAGQRQLLSFARALAHGADILVLDEATSSIDTETEALVQEGIHVLMEHKTAIVIAHRLSTIRDVDRIHVLHRGRIVEFGRHDELLAQRGVYDRLYRLQYAAQEAGAAAAS